MSTSSQFCGLSGRICGSGLALTVAAFIVAPGFTGNVFAQGIELQPRVGDPLPGLTQAEIDRFFAGLDRFDQTFSAETGLGPNFNDNSCTSCHNSGATGGAGNIRVTRFGRWDGSKFNPNNFDPLAQYGGSLLQENLVNHQDVPSVCGEVIPWEHEGWEDGANHSANRVTNAVFGMGLVEAIPDSALLANTGSNGVGGVAHMVPEIEHPDFLDGNAPHDRVGRFGWKAQLATSLSFAADATLMEQGVTSYLLPDPVPPQGDESLLATCDVVGPDHPQEPIDPVTGVRFIDAVADFQRFLAAPPQTPRSGMTGEQIFTDIGCAACHIPSFVTADDSNLEDAIRNKEIKPYSDFLLHSMGTAGDEIVQGDADGQHLRTPSLWGLRHREVMMHDGIEGGTFEDKLFGGGPIVDSALDRHRATLASPAAQDSALALAMLHADAACYDEATGTVLTGAACDPESAGIISGPDAAQLVADFLLSLGRAEYDFTGNNQVTDSDLSVMIDCYTGPSGSYVSTGDNPMDDLCAIGDIDQDGVIDEHDFAGFVMAYEGDMTECELWLALEDGVTVSVDVPSECVCPADLTGPNEEPDGVVDVFDLLMVIGEWGDCPRNGDCPADLTGPNDEPDGVVDVFDLLKIIGEWGDC